jgi:4a-hydroxytetrahydrobiopterin dehydratase
MTSLTGERCVACRADSPHVTDEEIKLLSPIIPEWELMVEDGIRKLQRTFHFSGFAQALAFTNQIGAIAEDEGHHPKLVTEWGRVGVTWWSHKIHDLHRNDFIMSSKTDMAFTAMGN